MRRQKFAESLSSSFCQNKTAERSPLMEAVLLLICLSRCLFHKSFLCTTFWPCYLMPVVSGDIGRAAAARSATAAATTNSILLPISSLRSNKLCIGWASVLASLFINALALSRLNLHQILHPRDLNVKILYQRRERKL
jgi:hypothetical protein